ncbi:MAG: transcriptional regulator [Planctomycetota bacterium]|jgi:DNA-binding PadR family transcriptional regulator
MTGILYSKEWLFSGLELSDGNLSAQIRKLEESGYIKVKKVFVERKPKTFCRITNKGRKAVVRLVKHLEDLVGPD